MRKLLLALVLLCAATAAQAQGCGSSNPNCVVPLAPNGDNSNRAASTAWVNANGGGGGIPALPSGDIFVGNGSNAATARALSGDCSLTNLGAITCTKTNGTNFGTLATAGAGTGLGISGSNLNLQPAAASTIGGIESIACSTHLWLSTISTLGVPSCTQPTISDIGGLGVNVATALGNDIGTAGSVVVFNGDGGTPSSITLSGATGLPIAGISGLGTGVGAWLAVPSSSLLAAAVPDETGSGSLVFGTAPTIDSMNATTAATLAYITGSTQCLQVNSSGTISGTSAPCGGSGSTPANPTATAGPTANNGSATTFMRSDASPAVQQGSASIKGIVQVDGVSITASAGVISAAQPAGANPTATAGPTATNGVATSFMRSDAAPAIQKATSSQFGIVEVDNTTITSASGIISATNSGTVSSVTCYGTAITTTGTCTTRGQTPGIASNTPASAGNVGEIISSCVVSGSPVSISSGTAKDVTSISLTAGDWNVEGNIFYIPAATTSISTVAAGISGTTNTFPTAPNNTAPFGGGGVNFQRFNAIVPGSTTFPAFALSSGMVPVTVNTTTSVFLEAVSAFTVSTNSAYGCIVARRVR